MLSLHSSDCDQDSSFFSLFLVDPEFGLLVFVLILNYPQSFGPFLYGKSGVISFVRHHFHLLAFCSAVPTRRNLEISEIST